MILYDSISINIPYIFIHFGKVLEDYSEKFGGINDILPGSCGILNKPFPGNYSTG